MKSKSFFSAKVLILTSMAAVLALLLIVVGIQVFGTGFSQWIDKGSVGFKLIIVFYVVSWLLIIGTVAATYVARYKVVSAVKKFKPKDISALEIRKANKNDIQTVAGFYDTVIADMGETNNLALWYRNSYPDDTYLIDAINGGTLYLAELNNELIGSVVINEKPHGAYEKGMWENNFRVGEYFVIHTLAVKPEYKRCGVAKALVNAARENALKCGKKAIRLDVTLLNAPAMHLYEGLGFTSAGICDLDSEENGIKAFQLYELCLTEDVEN